MTDYNGDHPQLYAKSMIYNGTIIDDPMANNGLAQENLNTRGTILKNGNK